MTATHVFCLVAVGACLTPGARAVEPSTVSTSGAGTPHPISDSEEPPAGPAASVAPESSFERAFRLRRSSSAVAPSWARKLEAPSEGREFASESSLLTSSALEGIERRNASDEPGPTTAAGADPSEVAGIPNHPALNDRFFFGAGAFAASSNTEARLDSPSGVGTTVDFEDLLGLESNDVVPWGIVRWRFTERWRLELEHFSLDRSNSATLGSDIIWGDQTFPAGTTINASFDIAVTRLSCGYSFFKRQDKELGIALGFHVTDIGAELVSTGGNGDDGKVLAPLPVLSMYGQFALTDLWAVAGRLDAFRLEYDPYEGHVFSLGIDALCQPWRNVGFGIGWRSLEVEFSAEKNSWQGEVATNYQGPIAFLAISF